MSVAINKYLLLLIGLLLSGLNGLQAQSARVRVDSSQVQVGQLIRLFLDVEVSNGARVSWPQWDDQLTSGLDIVDIKSVDTNLSNKGIHLHQEIHLISFDTGRFEIPPVPFVISAKGGADSLYGNQPIVIEVNLAPVDTSKAFMDIYPPVEVPFDWREYIPWVLGILVLLFMGYGLFRYLKKRKQRTHIPSPEPEPSLSPSEKALIRLRSLREEGYLDRKQFKLYQAGITDTLRLYMMEFWNFQAIEMSRFEILSQMEIQHLEEAERLRLKNILDTADLVKFAKVQLTLPEHERILDQAISFVENTSVVTMQKSEQDGGT